jgi:hypothetical protein
MYQRAAIFVTADQLLTLRMKLIAQPIAKSARKKNMAARPAMMNTIAVEIMVSRRVGQVTFDVSERTCCRNVNGLVLDAIDCSRRIGT